MITCDDDPKPKFLLLVHDILHRHHEDCILYVGKGNPTQTMGQKFSIHYHSVFDNKTLRNFRGHSDIVTDISMSPVNDMFLTSSDDRTCRLWDLQQATPLAEMNLPKNGVGADGISYAMDTEGLSCAAFDSTGLVYGITAPLANKGGHVSDSLLSRYALFIL